MTCKVFIQMQTISCSFSFSYSFLSTEKGFRKTCTYPWTCNRKNNKPTSNKYYHPPLSHSHDFSGTIFHREAERTVLEKHPEYILVIFTILLNFMPFKTSMAKEFYVISKLLSTSIVVTQKPLLSMYPPVFSQSCFISKHFCTFFT